MARVVIPDFGEHGWREPERAAGRARECCERLESGDVLTLGPTPWLMSDADRAVLRGVRQAGSAYLKNISYRPQQDRVRGASRGADADRLRQILGEYSRRVVATAETLLAPYASRWRLDFASFRSLEEEGRPLPTRQRNDLLHVDAFPTRPTNGHLILRAFTNLNSTRPRVWVTGPPFEAVAAQWAVAAGLPAIAAESRGTWRLLRRGIRGLGLPVADPAPYDTFMHRFHHYLKGSDRFQASGAKDRLEFEPGETWLVFTDIVPHSVLSGQFAVEQTFIVPADALALPHKAPVRVLERLCGTPLTV